MQQVIWEGDTVLGHYQVVDDRYEGRPARVMYSGKRQAAQSGIPLDDNPTMLFDYNQRLLELAEGLEPRSVLIIGGGVGTMTTALLPALPEVRIDVVEPDPDLSKLGYRFFDLSVDDRVRLFHTDGRSFLREHATRYDLIILDAFMHTTIPSDLQTGEAFQAYREHLLPSGLLAVNVISGYHGSAVGVLRQMYAATIAVFGAADVIRASRGYSLWLPQNFILVGYDDVQLRPDRHTRGELMAPPEVAPDAASHDTD